MNLKGPISKTKSGLRSPIETVSYERQSANAVHRDNFTSTILWKNSPISPYRQAYIMLD